MIHSSINICNEIEYISKKYEKLLENDAFYHFNKNKDIIASLNVHFKELKAFFNRYAIKKEKVEPTEMTGEKFLSFVTEVANMCKYDLIKLSKENVKTEYNIDIFDFMRKFVAMALNLTEKPEENLEDTNPGEKNDLEFVGLNPEQSVEKLLEEVIAKFKEKDGKKK